MKSDTQLQQEVVAELKWEPSIESTRIVVSVLNGVVTLVGHVANLTQKWNAARAVQRVSGVKAIAVKINIDTGD